jgi:hypothetical protein
MRTHTQGGEMCALTRQRRRFMGFGQVAGSREEKRTDSVWVLAGGFPLGLPQPRLGLLDGAEHPHLQARANAQNFARGPAG